MNVGKESHLNVELLNDVKSRFGLVPNFFRLALESPDISENLWGFAKFAYLDNPLPSLFKERLFVYASRFCEVRYCIARHVGFLAGLGHPSGDPSSNLSSMDLIIPLLANPLPRNSDLQPYLNLVPTLELSTSHVPDEGSEEEYAVFVCVAHILLQTSSTHDCLDALKKAYAPADLEYVLVLLTFIRTAHYWTKIHPELELEDDLRQLFQVQEHLAEKLFNDPEAEACELSSQLHNELYTLRREAQLMGQIKSSNEALREANLRKDDFLATLAHELRNPLAPIASGLEAMDLAIKNKNLKAVESLCSSMKRQTQQLTSLVNDLMDVSRISRGVMSLKMEKVELVDVITDAIDSVAERMETAEHTFVYDSGKYESIVVQGNQVRLIQIFSNLLDNAIKYSPDEGRVELKIDIHDKQVVVTVSDHGVGIPEEHYEKIFELFSQSGDDLEAGENGLGVGLSLVKKLVELHDGSVSVSSRHPDNGSQFVVRLPLIEYRKTPDGSKVASEMEKTTPCKVLLVDDNKSAADILGMLILMLGYSVDTVYNGKAALEIAPDLSPDVIFMDIGMPELNGYETAKRMSKAAWRRNTVLIALTGWGRDEDIQRTKEAGFDYHLVKPIDAEQLKKILLYVSNKDYEGLKSYLD
ncbi:hybrid sensor histidine kinase/response regulator [Alteromonas sp. ASW11-130]|uniref:hybrid sensor histidine kinase/response regulator n=1 Tax=Alteromonas sp. ASW11-130 TaxID=3015775 RepID=UPI00224231DC|nr:ATP-binding protein [Alteromonas sp. ASW11-130]MCW8091060.1 ATP-binding protein [Alteromonas sp. ASW11-130]